MGPAIAPSDQVSCEEVIAGDVKWLRVRARGAEWSWLTLQEAAALAAHWSERYGPRTADIGAEAS